MRCRIPPAAEQDAIETMTGQDVERQLLNALNRLLLSVEEMARETPCALAGNPRARALHAEDNEARKQAVEAIRAYRKLRGSD